MKHQGYLAAMAAACLLSACSLGPPDLSPVLSAPSPGDGSLQVFEFGGEGTRSYQSDQVARNPDSPSVHFGVVMNHLEAVGRWSLVLRRGGFLAAPFLANGGMAPGFGAGYAMPWAYAAGFVSAHWWDPISPGLSAQAGVKLHGNWYLRVDNFPVRYRSALILEDRALHLEPARMTRVSLSLRLRRGDAGGVAISPHALWNHTRGFPGGGVTVVVHMPSALGSGGRP